MKWSLGFVVTLYSLLAAAASQQDCDTSSDSTQCSEGEICRNNVCETAVPCDSSIVCSSTPDTVCVADYCQPMYCTATGECVHGQICSHNTIQSCVYPINLKAEENTRFLLNFTEPGIVGTYEEITWYKGGKGNNDRIVFFNEILSEDPVYYGDYCTEPSPNGCETSDKGELNLDTGTLTIYSVQLSDDGYYYYRFYTDSTTDTGHKYEIKLEVYVTPKQNEMSIEGISGEIVEVGTLLDLTCTINRIKPEAAEMYWVVNGRRKNGSITNVANDDGTFQQMNALEYTVAKEDEGKPIKCVVVPVYGNQVEVEQIVIPGYGPSGKPDLQPSRLERHAGEKVELTCNNPVDDGNPDCDSYTWNKVEGNGGTFPDTQTLEFIMEESSAGNYTCMCGNIYGDSDVSNKAEVIFLGEAVAMSARIYK